ncbi:hypothetical protein [Planococcus rifietoensis]|uniref:hypothetical protein n=1 Tax=Planococcus rifietoensis TaxID=200991 RepID=UPI00384BF46E
MDWKKSADELYDELQREKRYSEKLTQVINDIEEGYRGSETDLFEILDEYFHGGKSPVRD